MCNVCGARFNTLAALATAFPAVLQPGTYEYMAEHTTEHVRLLVMAEMLYLFEERCVRALFVDRLYIWTRLNPGCRGWTPRDQCQRPTRPVPTPARARRCSPRSRVCASAQRTILLLHRAAAVAAAVAVAVGGCARRLLEMFNVLGPGKHAKAAAEEAVRPRPSAFGMTASLVITCLPCTPLPSL